MANPELRFFFPPPPVLILVPPVNWRSRLRAAIDKSGRKHSAIAAEAKIDPTTLSRILNGHMQPTFETIVRVTRAANENVGWILDERGFSLSGDEQKQLRKVIRFLDDTVLGGVAPRRERVEPNAVAVANADVPRPFLVRGARLAYEVSGDAMLGAGIADGDLLFVKPTRSTREAAGRVVVCRVDAAEYARVLDVRGDRIRLLSRHDRFGPIDVADNRFELIGIVVGRTGPLA
jgi:phage repressor protein C with HTH and peptisase S24 domain